MRFVRRNLGVFVMATQLEVPNIDRIDKDSSIGEPCRVCGGPVTGAELRTAVFAGYGAGDKSRLAHRKCWDTRPPSVYWVHK